MKSTLHLYDIEPEELLAMNYLSAIKYKILKGKELLKRITFAAREVLFDQSKYLELLSRYLDVEKAIKYNNELLRELGE